MEIHNQQQEKELKIAKKMPDEDGFIIVSKRGSPNKTRLVAPGNYNNREADQFYNHGLEE